VVTAKTQYNLKNAREYFEEYLCFGDNYNEGKGVAGEWIGLGEERFGMSGKGRAVFVVCVSRRLTLRCANGINPANMGKRPVRLDGATGGTNA
jgi:hypothetical protein